MLAGAPPKKTPALGPYSHPSGSQQPPQPQHMVINLNGNDDNLEKEAVSMDVDQKPANGVLPTQNGRTATKRSASYAFSPPDDLKEHDISLRREVILLIQQLCIMGKNVQLPARLTLFRTLVDRGILFATQWALGLPGKDQENKSMVSAGGEVLSALIDHDLNGVRTHVLKQEVAIEKERLAGKKGADKAETLLELVCKIVTQCRDLAIQSQVGDALKAWLDVPPNDSPPMAASEVVFYSFNFSPSMLNGHLSRPGLQNLPSVRMSQERKDSWTIFIKDVYTFYSSPCMNLRSGGMSKVCTNEQNDLDAT